VRFDEGADRSAVQAARLVNLVAEGSLDRASFRSLWDVAAAEQLVDDEVVARLSDLAGRLREVFTCDDPRAVVNGLLEGVRFTPHVTDHDDRGPHLHFEPPGADAVERFEANTLMGLAVVLCDDNERLGTCAAERCGRAWADTSRNARRRFCSTACANRTHVAAHRARVRGDA
jgi:predicted RNA-binding Zn ribbon-like protein